MKTIFRTEAEETRALSRLASILGSVKTARKSASSRRNLAIARKSRWTKTTKRG